MTRLIHNSGLPLCSAPQQLPVICRKCCSTALAVLKFPLFAPKVLRNASLALCTRWETLSSRVVRGEGSELHSFPSVVQANFVVLLLWLPFHRCFNDCAMGDKIYADGTPATGDADGSFTAVRSKDWRQYAETWRPVTHGKKLHHNPPAAKTHKEEEGMPWRRAGEALVMADRRKAAVSALCYPPTCCSTAH